jgi:hypothetical protein
MTAEGWSDSEIEGVIARLSVTDLHKSQAHRDEPERWLDIYRPWVHGRRMYVKFTVNELGILMVLSFCRDREAH